MKGLGIDDMYIEENELDTEEIKEDTVEDIDEGIEEIPEDRTEKRKVRKLPLIVMLVIGLIIGIIISPYILDMFDEETPIYQEYVKIRGMETTIYKNEKLGVQVTKYIWEWGSDYNGEWTDINGQEGSTDTCDTRIECLDEVIYHGENLTTTQLRWFRYMLVKVIK